LDAVAAHRARLASRDGILEYSLLADDLPPMTYRQLGDSLRVTMPTLSGKSAKFLVLARRWERMLLTGLPGMGKSTALAQAAARWAGDLDAPVPLIVPLREIARQNPQSGTEVTLAVLIDAATAGVAEPERESLRRGLLQAVASGDAVLLLDGLDECRERRGVVADGLATVIRGLPPDTGVILSTRDSGLPAAGKLSMPEARLAEPDDMASVLASLLRHASQRIPVADRDHWASQREQRAAGCWSQVPPRACPRGRLFPGRRRAAPSASLPSRGTAPCACPLRSLPGPRWPARNCRRAR